MATTLDPQAVRTLFLQTKSKIRAQEDLAMSDFLNENGGGSKRQTRTGKKGATIPLRPEQVAKLWNIVVGGHLIIETDADTGETTYQVSLESFNRALPTLLERL